ncbi:unnamed protein product [Mytilus edulis]|uniref:Uncharacterized protein n=1 Tax=Mytilus edulis TaxID=6550 RepID=A0A8S3PZX5_MYTED|nr:unnamed protein product [Mytilus edulis]
MKFRQISFKSFQKTKSIKKKTKEASIEQQPTPIDDNDNLVIAADSCKYFDVAQDVSLRCSLRRYKTSVTPRNKYIITNRRTAISDDEEETDNGVLYELDDIDKVLNSVRKERTRIKTNPWIPPRKSVHEEDLIDLVPEGANAQDYLNVCILAEEAGKSYNSTESTLTAADNPRIQIPTRVKRQLSLTDLNINRWSIISEGDVDIELNSPTIEELNERFANIDYAIDFKYEENIDNILDDEMAVKLAKRLSVNDLLEDYSEASSDTSNSSMEISDNTSSTGSYSSEGSIENQLPVYSTKFSERPDRMEESIDAGYSSLSRDSRFPSTSDSDNAEHSDSDIEEESNMTLVDSACAECDSVRTIPGIRNSLIDKAETTITQRLVTSCTDQSKRLRMPRRKKSAGIGNSDPEFNHNLPLGYYGNKPASTCAGCKEDDLGAYHKDLHYNSTIRSSYCCLLSQVDIVMLVSVYGEFRNKYLSILIYIFIIKCIKKKTGLQKFTNMLSLDDTSMKKHTSNHTP